ncbi:MAG: hypothetical protein GF355_05940 [Candidatus Eisenbacteria bacterium]|nr:hypothetical protein [Candidatus Eisenbacteria bacterium]
MRRYLATLSVLLVTASLCLPASANENAEELGYREDTRIIPGPDEEICPGAILVQNDDGSFENGYSWRFGGVVPPEYGAWAECYDAEYVCGVELMLTQDGYFGEQDMDVYVWDASSEGNPPPGPDPANVLCVLPGIIPDPPAMWPDVSAHDYQVCCLTEGQHFVGYWPNWPGAGVGWYVAADEIPPEVGCPRTKIAPGIGYTTGWNHPNVVATFSGCRNLGLREYSGLGDCQPTAAQPTSWGRIKSLY